ncbi:MAG: hypothetical protein LQ337_007442, partial [Flavoplaca oasis]
YQIFLDASDVPSQYQHLLTRLRIEQTRLLNWGDQIGLLELSPKRPDRILSLNHNLLNDIMLEIQAALRGCLDIQTQFDSFIKSPSVSPQTATIQQKASTRKVLLDRALSLFDRSTRAERRLQWAMVKKDSFGKLVEKLILFNDRVESCLDRTTLEDLHGMQVQSNLLLLQITDDVTQLRFLIEALNITQTPVNWGNHREVNDRGSDGEASNESTVATLANFKAEALLVSKSISQHMHNRIEFGSIELENTDWDTSRSLGRYRSHHIWLEWREQVGDAQYSHDTQRIVDERVKQLATLLSIKDKSPLFNAPSCLGYTYDDRDDDRRRALVYKVENPPDSRYLGLCTLRDILKTNPVPSLAKRFALASTLADSLFYLHAVSWLHKGIRSDNILFIRYQSTTIDHEPSNSTMTDLSGPILSGFDYARPDLIDEQSFRNTKTPRQDLYSHPDLLQFRTKRSRKCHDMYSLGLIFIELALWRPIENIFGIEVRRSRLLEVAQTVAKLNDKGNTLSSELAARVGDRYIEVINSCVVSDRGNGAAAGSKEDDPEVAAELQRSFFENVVQKLRRLTV